VVRARRVSERARELGELSAQVEASRRALGDRAREGAAFEAACREVSEKERVLFEAGKLRVTDLEREAQFALGASQVRADLGAKVQLARASLAKADGAASAGRRGLAKARADAELVTRDRARFEKAEESQRERAEQDEAEDAHAAQARRRWPR